MWLNGLGILLKKGLVDLEMVYDMTGGFGPIVVWEKYGDVIKLWRKTRHQPDMFSPFEYLAEEVARFMKEKGLPSKWSEDQNSFVSNSPDS